MFPAVQGLGAWGGGISGWREGRQAHLDREWEVQLGLGTCA